MDFAKFLIMGIFLNLILGSALNIVTTGVVDNLENNGLQNLVIDNNADSTIVDQDRGILSTLYESTIGNVLNWGANILSWIGIATLGDSDRTYYEMMKAISPITAYLFLLIIMFQIMFNLYLGLVTYRFIKNKNG